jgi:hypothetical protein
MVPKYPNPIYYMKVMATYSPETAKALFGTAQLREVVFKKIVS